MEFEHLPTESVRNHQLMGILYSKYKKVEFEEDWKENSFRNLQHFAFLRELSESIKGLPLTIVLMKGIRLLTDLYPDVGERRLSDIDFYVPENHRLLVQILGELGFTELSETKWWANEHKTVLQGSGKFIGVVVEIHTKLFMTSDYSSKTLVKSKMNSEFFVLDESLEFIYLCYHLAYQHTFAKLFWLEDIERFLLKYQRQMDFDFIQRFSESLGVRTSLEAVVYVLSIHSNLPEAIPYRKMRGLRGYLLRRLLTKEFLIHPMKKRFSYAAIKFLLRDSYWQGVKYFFRSYFKNVPG